MKSGLAVSGILTGLLSGSALTRCFAGYLPNNPRKNNHRSENSQAPSQGPYQENDSFEAAQADVTARSRCNYKPRVLLFGGHVPDDSLDQKSQGGTLSCIDRMCKGGRVREYRYNDDIVNRFNSIDSCIEYIVLPAAANIKLKQRPERVAMLKPDIVLSIHYDAVDNDEDIEYAKSMPDSRVHDFAGFSFQIDENASVFDQSYFLSRLIGGNMKNLVGRCSVSATDCVKPNTYHSRSNRKMKLIDPEYGVYHRGPEGSGPHNSLYMLSHAPEGIPLVIMELGTIVIPQQEAFLAKESTRQAMIQGIHQAFLEYFGL